MNDATGGAAVGTAPGVGQGVTDALIALVDVLGKEQKLLERLVFTVAQAALLMAAGADEHLVPASDEIVDAARVLGALELARAMVVAEIAEQWDLGVDQPTLAAIQQAAPEAFATVLAARRAEMQRLSEEIATLSITGSELAEAGRRRLEQKAADVGRTVSEGGYGSDGAPVAPASSPVLSDRFA